MVITDINLANVRLFYLYVSHQSFIICGIQNNTKKWTKYYLFGFCFIKPLTFLPILLQINMENTEMYRKQPRNVV